MIKQLASILFLIYLTSFCLLSDFSFKKIGEIEFRTKKKMSAALVLKDFFMIKFESRVLIFDKQSFTLHSSYQLKEPGFSNARAIYYSGNNTYSILNQDESKAVKLNSNRIVGSAVINSPKDWYIFIDEVFNNFYQYFRLRDALYQDKNQNEDDATAFSKYYYRWNIAHDNHQIFLFTISSYSTFTLPNITFLNTRQFFGRLGWPYNILGIINKKYVLTSISPPDSQIEFYIISALNESNDMRIDYSFLKKYLIKNLKTYRVCVYANRIFLFIQIETKIVIYTVSIG